MSGDKATLRLKMREMAETRRNVRPLSSQLVGQLLHWPTWQSSGVIAAFSALAGEPDPLDPWPHGKRIALPRVCGDELAFHLADCKAGLLAGRFGIPEPPAEAPDAGKQFDLILVPGLAFDLRGGRLGRGKGFYDRFLATARGIRAGVCFEDQIVTGIPVEEHDLRMDFVITPAAIYRCGS
ncbi:MAG: 5-formyltetrahydrofolate cyclo-ligase [Terrimicrobiaceae bacterium]